MTKKTNIIFAIGTFSILFLSFVGYFGINYVIDKDFQEKTIQCSNDTEKRRESLKDEKFFIHENFYSKKLKTCLITGNTHTFDQVYLNAKFFIKELYTGKVLNTFTRCDSKDECAILADYNKDRISDLAGIKEEQMRTICLNKDREDPLKKYCSLIKSWDGNKELQEKTDSYR